MSEKIISPLEKHESHEKTVTHEHHERAEKHRNEQAEKARAEKSTENLEKIRELAKAEANEAKKVVSEQAEDETDSLLGVQHSLKATAYERTLARIQHKLPRAARAFSRIAHSPVVDKVSAVSAQTVARPSGVLGGGICAFLGSLIALYYSKHYGFKYNYLLLLFLFVAGYLVGATLELAVWLVYSRKQRY